MLAASVLLLPISPASMVQALGMIAVGAFAVLSWAVTW